MLFRSIASKAAFGNLFWRCYKTSGAGGDTVSATNNSMPFKDFSSVAATVSAITTISPDDDEMHCKNMSETTFKNAMGSFGFKNSTPREIYCDINNVVSGAVVSAASSCPVSTGTGDTISINTIKVAEAILQKAGSIHGYVSYYIGYKMLVQECGVTDKGTRSKDDGLGGYPQIGIVKEDGTVEIHAYELANADSVITMWNSGYGYYKTSCKDILRDRKSVV